MPEGRACRGLRVPRKGFLHARFREPRTLEVRFSALSLGLLVLGLAVSSAAQASTTTKVLYALGSYNSDRGRAYTVCGLTVSQRTTPQVGYDDVTMMSAVDCTT